MIKNILLTILLLTFGTLPAAAMSPESAAEQEQLTAEAVEQQKEEAWQDNLIKEAQKWLNSSKQAGERSADWLKEDVKRMGDFEYKIVRIPANDDQALTAQLNELGSQRWEVYWVQEQGDQIRFFLKRTARTYMKHVPVGDMLRLIPKESGS